MLDRLKSFWNFGSTYCGIEVVSIDGFLRFRSVSAKKHKGEFVGFEFYDAGSFEELVSSIGKNRHAFLVVNTDQVLIKEMKQSSDLQKSLSETFPGISTDSVYYDTLSTYGKGFASICRKERVDDLLKKAHSAKLSIVGFRLGFLPLSNILTFLKYEEIDLSNYKVQLNGQNIVSFEKEAGKVESYSIEDLKVGSEYLLALSGLMEYMSPSQNPSNLSERNESLSKEYLRKVFFRKGLALGLGVLLLLLLVNMFFYTGYRKEFIRLNEETELASLQKKELQERVVEIEKKEKVVQNILGSGSSNSTFFMNRVITSAPPSIVFSKAAFQPMKKNIRPDKPIEYIENSILLIGESKDKTAFSRWIEDLEELQWVLGVQVNAYGSENSNTDNFEISMKIQDDTAQ